MQQEKEETRIAWTNKKKKLKKTKFHFVLENFIANDALTEAS